jgi:hypothetical protein
MFGISQSGLSVDPLLFTATCAFYNASIILGNALYSKSLYPPEEILTEMIDLDLVRQVRE